MEEKKWIAQLGRLYKEVSDTEDGEGAKEYAEQFNRTLSNLQESFPEEDFVQNTTPVDKDVVYTGDKIDLNKEIQLKCGQLADVLGYDLPESDLQDAENINIISLKNSQAQKADQTTHQENSIEIALEMVNYTTLNQKNREELKEIIHEFENELHKDNPDSTALQDLLKSAKTYSVDVSAKLAMMALGEGIIDIIDLGN